MTRNRAPRPAPAGTENSSAALHTEGQSRADTCHLNVLTDKPQQNSGHKKTRVGA